MIAREAELAETKSIQADLREVVSDSRATRLSERKKLVAEGWEPAEGQNVAGVYYRFADDPTKYRDALCNEACVVVLIRTDSQRECPSSIRVTGGTVREPYSLTEISQGLSRYVGTWSGATPAAGPGATSVVALTHETGASSGGIAVTKIECF